MNLIVGATGLLGGRVCSVLLERHAPVRALVRGTSNPDKVAALRGGGAEIAIGDLKDRRSLDAACRGVTTVVSTASSTLSRQAGDSIESVDGQGQLNLIDAAEAAGVRHFILVSFPSVDISFPLQDAKRAAEERLARGRMTYTILQPTFFTEVWLGPALGFDAANGSARIYGSGRNKVSWVSFLDVARYAAAAVDNPQAANAVVKLGGPDDLSPLEAVGLAEQITGRRIAVEHVPEDALRAQHAGATDSLQKSFAALMLYCAGGDIIDSAEARRLLAVDGLRSVREHLQSSVAQSAHTV